MSIKQRITVLGSTGSIGKNTLDVLARHPDRFSVYALTASTQVDLMLAQCAQFRPQVAVMVEPLAARRLSEKLQAEGIQTEVRSGTLALDEVASAPDVDAVMAAIVGAAGLSPCLAAARAGKRLLLANKEALVVGGEVFLSAVKEGGAVLLPIDSEHSAVFQSLPEDPATWQRRVDKIILTASGGPFRGRDPSTLKEVTPEQACAHPNWVMGRKISVDSATMMNKALEVIEARYLFGMTPEQIEVIIHPQSIVHSMVEFVDGSIVAQLGTPDMRMPISYGLAWPDRIASGAGNIDFRKSSLMTFESMQDIDHQKRFPGLALAWEALKAPSGTTAVLNAANEVAVALFLAGEIQFDQIHAVNLATLSACLPEKPRSLEDLLEIDTKARLKANEAVNKMLRKN
jgi:1-deoxy-D-xylulose-5-phosphate reductoisomerase